MTVLGVTFNNMLSFRHHIQNVTAKVASSLYALKTLEAGLVYNLKHSGERYRLPSLLKEPMQVPLGGDL